jgi:chaperonin GroEL
MRAIEEPLRQIANNAGSEGSVVIDKVKNSEGANGYNADTDTYEDLIKAGVIDPTKVVRLRLAECRQRCRFDADHRGHDC